MKAKSKLIDRVWTSRVDASAHACWCAQNYGKTFAVCKLPDKTFRVGLIGPVKRMGYPIVFTHANVTHRRVKRTMDQQREEAEYCRTIGNVVNTARHFGCSPATVYRILSRFGVQNDSYRI